MEYLFLFITNNILEKRTYLALLQASTILSCLSNNFYTRICTVRYFINLNFNQQFLNRFLFNEKKLIRLSKWIYPAFYNLSLIDKALQTGKGLLILNVHSFDHFALQLLLQKKYSNICTIIMDKNVDYFLNTSKANTNNQFFHYKDKNLFMKLRTALINNGIVVIHQDLFNMGSRSININFMGQTIPILENIAAYLSFYTSSPIITSYTHSVCGMLCKVKFSPFEISNVDNLKEYINIFHQKMAHYIESFVKKYPSQWMGWKYLNSTNIHIEETTVPFFPDYICFDKKQNCFMLFKLFPLHIIKLKPSKMHINFILYFYKLMIDGIKSYNKKS